MQPLAQGAMRVIKGPHETLRDVDQLKELLALDLAECHSLAIHYARMSVGADQARGAVGKDTLTVFAPSMATSRARRIDGPRVTAARIPGVRRIVSEVARTSANAVAHELGVYGISRAPTPFREPLLRHHLQLLDASEQL